MVAPSSPSERESGWNAEDRSPDSRLIQPPSQSRTDEVQLQWLGGHLRVDLCFDRRAVAEFPRFAVSSKGTA
jgi:hypothetical protein